MSDLFIPCKWVKLCDNLIYHTVGGTLVYSIYHAQKMTVKSFIKPEIIQHNVFITKLDMIFHEGALKNKLYNLSD